MTFAQRGCEELDAAERDALNAHLDKCPDCAAITQAEHRLDEVLGKVMREVPVPAGLQASILKKLSEQRRPIDWTLMAAAAAVFLLVIGGATWFFWPTPAVTLEMAHQYAVRAELIGKDRERVEQYFMDLGLEIRAPHNFNYDYLHNVDVVEFEGRRVAKLTFYHGSNFADVLVLSPRQFRVDALPETVAPDTITMRIREEEGTRYLITVRGDYLSLLLRTDN